MIKKWIFELRWRWFHRQYEKQRAQKRERYIASRTYYPDERFLHPWHVAINTNVHGVGWEKWEQSRFMYEAKDAAYELPRLAAVFKKEREGHLAKMHQQCSYQDPVPVPENYLTCCLGVKCKECPYLLALEGAQMSDAEKDHAKAWTCVTHIISKGGDDAREGYVLSVDDRMYWDNLHASLAAASEIEEEPS